VAAVLRSGCSNLPLQWISRKSPNCEKMFDSRKGYTTTNLGIACADIRNGRQLFFRGAGSGDKVRQKIYKRVWQKIYKRLKDFSIPIKQQHGANHDAFCPNDVRKKLRSRVIFIA